jgi:hypothetical protein
MQRHILAFRHLALAALSALVGLTACGKPRVDQGGGQLTIQASPGTTATFTTNANGSKLGVDFGSVPITQRRVATLDFANVGNSDLTILKVSQDSADAEFSVDVTQGQVFVAGGAAVAIPIHFVPFTTGAKAAKVTLTTDSSFLPTIEISMTGIGIKLCVSLLPQAIDFGSVVVNTTDTQAIAMTNCSGIDVTVTLGPLKGTDPLLFTTVPAAGAVLTLHSEETASVTVQYTPLVASPTPNQAYFSMTLCSSGAGCEPLVSLRGTAVSTGLAIAPTTLDFGFVPPGRGVPRSVTLTNVANAPIRLTADPTVQNSDSTGGSSSAGAFQPGAGFPSNGALIPPGQSIEVPVVFTPATTGKFTGELALSTDDANQPNVKIPLTGFGGGAVILCSPLGLEFGLNAVGITSTLSVLCTNIGQNVPDHPEANLFIPDPNSPDQGLTIQNGDQAFQPAFDQPFPTAGLAAGQSVKINVTYAPIVGGVDSDTLIVSSNDSVNPKTSISLSGNAKVLRDCDFTLNPSNGLAFGHIDKGNDAILPFEIVNNGTDECLVNALQVAAGGSSAFSLPDYPVGAPSSVVVPGSGSLEVAVRFAPTTQQASFAGSVSFTISNKARQHQNVSLTGSSLSGCLLILPNPLDFGVVGFDPVSGHWCKSAKRTVTVRNTCDTQDVSVNSISVVDLAASQEFILTGDPSPVTVPKVCQASAYCPPATPVTFQVSFEPTGQGKHTGGIKIYTSDLTDPYLIALAGDAETNSVQTDNFTGHKAAIDVLWVMDTDDDSSGHQAIIANLSNFLYYPLQNNIDFHMAATSTDVYATNISEQGAIEPCPHCKLSGNAPRVVSSSEGLDAVGALSRLLNLGEGYGCWSGVNCNGFYYDEMFFESAYEALSPALLNGYNKPFYRPDAFLAVITVNNDSEDDRSTTHGLNYYYNAFVGVKGSHNANKFSYSYVNQYGGINNNQRMAQMVQLTGGVEADLSNTGTPNWTDELNALWPQIATQLLEYPLSGTPVTTPMTITVTDNGVTIPQLQNGFPQWTYDPKNNAVQFDPLAFPQPGDMVQISYTIACNN